MGFFSGGGIGGMLGGGTKGTATPMTNAFALAPESVRTAYTGYADLINNLNITPEMFTPQALTAGEEGAIGNINKGFAATPESIQSDIEMQMNPFDQFVLDAINRESTGANSILKQNLQGAGQSGSNRQMLGANDIDLTRLQQIGGFKQGQYNTALQNALGTLTNARRQDAGSQLGAGEFLRNLDLQTKQAPVAAAGAEGDLLSALNAVLSASQPVQSGTAGTKGNALTGIGNIASIASMFSDISLKENIISVGTENGHNVYEFNYIGSPERYVGVMAQEVQLTHPESVVEIDGKLAVNYSDIGVEFRRVS